MITIDHLEVQFDVSGDEDEAVFARYFARFIREWLQLHAQERRSQRRLRQDRMLGDIHEGGDAEW